MELIISNANALLWLLLMIVCLVAEASTATLFSVWFAIGSLASMIIALLGLPLWLQILVFVAVSGMVLLLTKPLTEKMINQKTIKTNADRVIGSIGIVKKDISNITGTGLIDVSGQIWSARSLSGQPIKEGQTVVVNKIEGVKLIVDPVENSEGKADN